MFGGNSHVGFGEFCKFWDLGIWSWIRPPVCVGIERLERCRGNVIPRLEVYGRLFLKSFVAN